MVSRGPQRSRPLAFAGQPCGSRRQQEDEELPRRFNKPRCGNKTGSAAEHHLTRRLGCGLNGPRLAVIEAQRLKPWPGAATFSPGHGSGSITTMPKMLRTSVWPNPSVNPRPATAGSVSLVCGAFGTFAHQAYAACLRGRGYLER